MRNVTHAEHAAEHLADVDRCCTHQHGSSRVAHEFNFLDNSKELLLGCLIDAVGHIIADDRLVGGDGHDIQFVDVHELTSLGLGSTGHTRQLVIHAEVVLQGDGGKGLCGSLYLHVLFRFHSLMQSVAPSAAFHYTSGLFVYDFHFSVDNDIFVVFIEHGVCFQQLLQRVHTFALYGVFCHQFVFLFYYFLFAESLLCFECRHLCCNVGQDKQFAVVDLIGEPFRTLVGKVA